MANKNIHGFNVEYDDSSDTLKTAVHYLADKLDKSEVEIYFDAAHRDLVNHKAHFEVRDHEKGRDHNLTLIYDGNNNYHLRKRMTY